jgi:predicted SprT family Zn-dependent metalloprotease
MVQNNETYIVTVEDEFLNESCYYCQEEFEKVEDILVTEDEDRYICKECAELYDIKTIDVIGG